MLCEACGERQATVHLTRVVNGEKTERHLCERCAKEEGDFEFMFELEPKFSINQLLAGILQGTESGLARRLTGRNVIRCDFCGMSYDDFARTGKFGCNHCYEAFEHELKPLFNRLHGTARHTGKVPGGVEGDTKLRQQIDELRDQLAACVSKERFERAAELRDEIRRLEKELHSADAGKEQDEK